MLPKMWRDCCFTAFLLHENARSCIIKVIRVVYFVLVQTQQVKKDHLAEIFILQLGVLSPLIC